MQIVCNLWQSIRQLAYSFWSEHMCTIKVVHTTKTYFQKTPLVVLNDDINCFTYFSFLGFFFNSKKDFIL